MASRIPAMRAAAGMEGRIAPRPRIGVALSAGGARGLAHVGVIQVLEENAIPVDVISGTSMGAYVGALWAFGCDGAELEALAAEIRSTRHLFGLVDLALPCTRGLVRGVKVRQRLERTIGPATFEDLPVEFLAVAGNVRTLRRRVFQSGPVAEAVHASFAIPGICVPVEIGGEMYVDGGVVEPVPVPVLHQHSHADRVIAVSVVPTLDDVAHVLPDPLERRSGWRNLPHWLNRSWNVFAPGNLVEILQRSVLCGQVRMAEDACQMADVVIHPELKSPRWHDYQNWREYIRAGRTAALEALPRIKALLTTPLPPAAAAQPRPRHEYTHSHLPLGSSSAG
jgi:NTE family protein